MAPSHRSGPSARRWLNACGMTLTQGGEQARDDLVGAEAGGVRAEVGPSVVGLALPAEGLDLVGRAPRQHRPVAGAARALVELAEIAPQPHDGTQLEQRLHPPVPAREASASGDDVARLQRQELEGLGLQLAEPFFAGLAEDFGD